MKYKKIIMTPKTSFSQMFSSDQLWGQMVWAISDLKGCEAASEFVEQFKTSPPFLLSSLLPDGFLPMPIVPSNKKAETPEEKERYKKIRKCKWIPISDFYSIQKDIFKLYTLKIENKKDPDPVVEVHASIDRATNKVKEGALYNQHYIFSEDSFCVYVKFLSSDPSWENTLEKVVQYFGKVGLGGDRNVGHGQFAFEIKDVAGKEEDIFNYFEGNSFMTLSKCFGPDLIPVSYSLEVYAGISGKGLSEASLYRKKPIIQFLPGSIFKAGEGVIAEGVSTDARVCSYGLVLPIQLKYEEGQV